MLFLSMGISAISQVIVNAGAPVATAAQYLNLFEMAREFPLTGLLSRQALFDL